MATAANLIKSSLRLIGAIASGETPTAAETQDALESLNHIIEDWSNEGFLIFERSMEEFTMSSGVGSYAIGDGATFDTERPHIIQGVNFKQAGHSEEWQGKVYSTEEWHRICLKTLQTDLPQGIYYNPTYPNGTIHVWPVPKAAHALILFSLKPITKIESSSDDIVFPPGYEKALRYELADDLADEYGTPNPRLYEKAQKYKANIARTNFDPLILRSDAFGLCESVPYDIYRGPVR